MYGVPIWTQPPVMKSEWAYEYFDSSFFPMVATIGGRQFSLPVVGSILVHHMSAKNLYYLINLVVVRSYKPLADMTIDEYNSMIEVEDYIFEQSRTQNSGKSNFNLTSKQVQEWRIS